MTLVRAAVHVHSDWSYDGQMSLDDVSRLLAGRGYDAVFMCEHDRGFTGRRKREYDAACADASAGGPLLVPGIEYADPEDRIHLPVWGVDAFLGEGIATRDVLVEAARFEALAVIAHPRRRDAWRILEPEWLELSSGIEIWTRKWDGWAPNDWAVRCAAEAGLVGVVSLDLHRPGQAFPLAMELEVEGPVTAAACIQALRSGRCRALVRGLPIAPLTRGGLARTANRVERLRRPVFRHGRLVRDRLVGAR